MRTKLTNAYENTLIYYIIIMQLADTPPPPYFDGDMTYTAHEHFLFR
jgi:hypothetical protein